MERFISSESQFLSAEFMEFLNATTFAAPNWKWIAAVLIFVVGYILFLGLRLFFRKVRKTSFLRRGRFLEHLLDLKIEGSTAMIFSTLVAISLLESIALPGPVAKYLAVILHLLLSYNVIRLSYWGVEALGMMFADFASKTSSTIDDQLAPIATKTLKVLVVIVGILIILQNFGVNVTALLAGLGIGGVAIAFAAQDTVANLFGTVTILTDSPFKLGDLVRIGDTEGTVEEVGFRSTRIRTAYNSVVVFPNSTIAKEKIDNLGERPQVRFRHNFGLHYNTSSPKITEFCERIKYLLTQHPHVDRDRIVVVLNAYLDSSLNVLVNAHLKVKDAVEELQVQDKILHEILQISKDINVEFAYPTRTLYVQPMDSQLPCSPAAPLPKSSI